MYGDEVEEKEGLLPIIPHYIFKMMEETGTWVTRREIADRLARVMEPHVEEEGSREVRAVSLVMIVHDPDM